jgi:putative membrane protein
MYDGDHMTTGGWIFGSVTMVLLIVLVVIAITWLLRWSEGGRGPSRTEADSGGSAREMLDRRLASGEIDEDEYRRLRATLSEPQESRPVEAGP